MSSPSNPFLFVNESGNATSYKVGYRPDVRSHIRKHVARGQNKRKVSHGEQEVDLAPGAAGMQLRSSSARSYDAQPSPPLYCKACGRYVDSSSEGNMPAGEHQVHTPSQMWRTLLRLSPREVLRSGRVDPFLSSGPILDPQNHELMDLGN